MLLLVVSVFFVPSFVLWLNDDVSLGSKLVAVQTKLFTSELVVIVNVDRHCNCYNNGGASYKT
jgi:hypothetical protein